MFPYMALTIADDSIPFDSTHAVIYQEAARHMTASDFDAVSLRQSHLHESPQAFRDILKYFEIKPGYLLAIRLGHGLGLNLVMATYMPSLVSYFFICCLLFIWIQKILPLPIAAMGTLLLAASSFLIQTARYSSPDMMCAIITLAGLFLIAEYSAGIGLLICGLAIPVRPDSIILFLFLTIVLYRTKKIGLLPSLAVCTTGVFVAVLILGDLGLLQEFLFIDSSYSSAWTTTELIQRYFLSVRSGLTSLINSQTFIFLFLAAVTLYLRMKNREIFNDRWSPLIVAAIATMVARYLLHPVVEDRFQISCYLLVIIGFCKTVSGLITPKAIGTLH